MLFGGWESASRGAGVTLQLIGERLGIADQFFGVDQIDLRPDGSFEVLERVEGGKHQVSVCAGAPAVLGWATGNLAEPRNNPQIGMSNMRTIMPALQRAKTAALEANSLEYVSVSLPKQQRTTRVEKNMTPDEIAAELVGLDWERQLTAFSVQLISFQPLIVRSRADSSELRIQGKTWNPFSYLRMPMNPAPLLPNIRSKL